MSKVILNGFMIVPDDDLDTVEKALPRHTSLTHQEKGCLAFKVSRDKMNHNRFNVYEAFVNRAAFDLHQTRVEASDWGRITANVERHYDILE